jgi:hypothetical protein
MGAGMTQGHCPGGPRALSVTSILHQAPMRQGKREKLSPSGGSSGPMVGCPTLPTSVYGQLTWSAVTALSLCPTAFNDRTLGSSWRRGMRSPRQLLYDLDQVGGQNHPGKSPCSPSHGNPELHVHLLAGGQTHPGAGVHLPQSHTLLENVSGQVSGIRWEPQGFHPSSHLSSIPQ